MLYIMTLLNVYINYLIKINFNYFKIPEKITNTSFSNYNKNKSFY